MFMLFVSYTLVISLSTNEGALRQDKGNNESVQSKSLGENEDKNHSNEKLFLLTDCPDTSISDNSNGHSGGKTGQTAAQTGGQMRESGVETVL